jgi:DNA-binding NtrC family response regulator
MEILLVEKDPLVRDHVKVGLQQYPEFNVTVGVGYQGINELRGRAFDCVFLGIDAADQDSTKLLQHLRSFDKTTELIVMTSPRHSKDMAVDKAKYDIHSFLQTPIDVKEFFGFLGRFLDRRSLRSSSSVRKEKQGARGSTVQVAGPPR